MWKMCRDWCPLCAPDTCCELRRVRTKKESRLGIPLLFGFDVIHGLRNVYLPPFAAAVGAGAGNIMTSYVGINGVPGAADRRLMVLRASSRSSRSFPSGILLAALLINNYALRL